MVDPANRNSVTELVSLSNYIFAVVVDAQILTVNTEVGVCGAGCSLYQKVSRLLQELVQKLCVR